MKTSLKPLAALLIAVSFPAVAFAEMIRATVPVVVTAENMISVFAIVSVGLIGVLDYSRTNRRRLFRPASAGVTRPVVNESHRLAA